MSVTSTISLAIASVWLAWTSTQAGLNHDTSEAVVGWGLALTVLAIAAKGAL